MMHVTLDGRIANAEGGFWEPFLWGAEDEMQYTNEFFRTADIWAFGRVTYEGIVPWWDLVARDEIPADVPEISDPEREFGRLQAAMRKVVFSRSLASSDDRTVINGNIAEGLTRLKDEGGGGIVLSCGPDVLAQLAEVRGLIDEYLLVVHPTVITSGPRLLDGVRQDLALELIGADVFDGRCVVLRHRPAS